MVSPLVLIAGMVSFTVSFLVHILIWRIIKPVKQTMWLVAIFIILPVCGYCFLFFFSGALVNLALSIILHILLSLGYIMTYPAIQAECPSLKIILAVRGSMPEGLSLESISDLFSGKTLFSNSFDSLVSEGLISFKNEKCILLRKGRLVSIFFSAYRRLLGLPEGEG